MSPTDNIPNVLIHSNEFYWIYFYWSSIESVRELRVFCPHHPHCWLWFCESPHLLANSESVLWLGCHRIYRSTSLDRFHFIMSQTHCESNGVPQGLVLGTLLFSLSGQVLWCLITADDTQYRFLLSEDIKQVSDITSWMRTHHLKLYLPSTEPLESCCAWFITLWSSLMWTRGIVKTRNNVHKLKLVNFSTYLYSVLKLGQLFVDGLGIFLPAHYTHTHTRTNKNLNTHRMCVCVCICRLTVDGFSAGSW